VESGECSLLAAANRARTVFDILARAWVKATPDERREFCRAAGFEAVWTALSAAIG
jgi:hypothetical protein